jgi:hypothetical protein
MTDCDCGCIEWSKGQKPQKDAGRPSEKGKQEAEKAKKEEDQPTERR